MRVQTITGVSVTVQVYPEFSLTKEKRPKGNGA